MFANAIINILIHYCAGILKIENNVQIGLWDAVNSLCIQKFLELMPIPDFRMKIELFWQDHN